MTEKGTVREIRENIVIVAPDMSAACFGCMNQECKTAGGIITAENPNDLPLVQGQTVEVRFPGVSLVGQTLTALLPPAIGFIVSFFLARLLFPNAGEAAHAAIGVVFLFAIAFLVYHLRKKYPPPSKAGTITRIID